MNKFEKPKKLLLEIIKKLGWKKLDNWARNYYANPYEGKIYSVAKLNGKLKQLNNKPGSNGYRTVKLKGVDGKYHTKSEHRLIANAFIPNPENKRVCHHINHNRVDNRVSNLEWTNHKDNSRRRKDNDKCNLL